MRILTIEDDADFAAILNLMLRGEGFDVHSVATGTSRSRRSLMCSCARSGGSWPRVPEVRTT